MAVLSIEQCIQLTENIENKLDEANEFANSTKKCLTHEEVFKNIKNNLSKDDESSF